MKAAIVGYSGHAYVVIEAARSVGIEVIGYYEKVVSHFNPFDLTYFGDETKLNLDTTRPISNVILGIGDNSLRRKLGQYFREKGFHILPICHENSLVSSYASIGDGSFVARGAVVNPMAQIGEDVIINSGAIVEHGCQIGSGSHIAPGAILNGDVQTGEQCFVGAGAVIKEGIHLGHHVVVGGGAVVLHNIPDHETWVGLPAKKKI